LREESLHINGLACLVVCSSVWSRGFERSLRRLAKAWAVHLGHLDLTASWPAFLGDTRVRWVLTAFALFELVVDQLPGTASRTVPWQFAGRLITGTLSGAAIGTSAGHALWGALAGLVGAVVGTLGGVRVRTWIARALHNDHAAAVIENAVAIGGAVLLGFVVR
jgi:uncharacterized membrane protein